MSVGAPETLFQSELVHFAGQEAAGAHRQGLQVVRISDRPKRAGQQLLFSVSEQAAESRIDLKEPSLVTHERESDGSAVEGVPGAHAFDAGPLLGGLAVAS